MTETPRNKVLLKKTHPALIAMLPPTRNARPPNIFFLRDARPGTGQEPDPVGERGVVGHAD
jgi:hypothetical protein